MIKEINYPYCEGLWRCMSFDSNEVIYECDIYYLPNGILCAWCDECNRHGMCGSSDVWNDDQRYGHIPVNFLQYDGTFTLIGE